MYAPLVGKWEQFSRRFTGEGFYFLLRPLHDRISRPTDRNSDQEGRAT